MIEELLDRKILKNFQGKIVRKDLSSLMKKGANVPTYVLEYLLGMYCSTDDEELLKIGVEKIKAILSKNYVSPEQSEYIKSKIRELGEYTIIDKVSVKFEENDDLYVAEFRNLKIKRFNVSPDLVFHNEKLLLGGIWCIVTIKYNNRHEEDDDLEEFFLEEMEGSSKKKAKRKKKTSSRFSSPFEITNLRPIQMPNLELNEIIEARKNFSKDEWISLLIRSIGYEPTELDAKQKFHYLLRIVPLIQKNYNLVELGPRGTGKSHVYSELSPYSILISGGHTTAANMFYNVGRDRVGLVGNWDCVAFDEVGGMNTTNLDTIQIMKNYMANGTFARGTDAINADASIAFEGNTFRSVNEMLRTTNLFEPFPPSFNSDSAFFDRIHAYLPGWETPKLRASLFAKRYGFISDCLAEFCHEMRKYDFTDEFSDYFELNKNFNTRDDVAVRKTFSGLVKLIYPDGKMSKEEIREILEYSIECRRRVKEQLKKMTATEFNAIDLGYIDKQTKEEFIIEVPEQPKSALVFDGFEPAGYVYAVGKSVKNKVAIYRLENKLIEGNGKLEAKNIEGIGYGDIQVKKSLIAAFNYFYNNANKLLKNDLNSNNYSLYYNDLQNKDISEEISVAEVVGLFSALCGRPVNPSTIIAGRVVMSGSMMPISTSLSDIVVAASSAGAKNLLLPNECKREYNTLSMDLKESINVIFYTTPLDASKKALGIQGE